MELIQKILLGLDSFFQKTGLTENTWFKRVFGFSYFLYKKYIEYPFLGLTQKRPELFQGDHILDIGSNIGYRFTLFSKVVTPGFKVYAFEPEKVLKLFEEKNYLIYILGRRGKLKPARNEVIEAMVEKRGYIDLICSRKELLL